MRILSIAINHIQQNPVNKKASSLRINIINVGIDIWIGYKIIIGIGLVLLGIESCLVEVLA